jgi:uncharacterized protein YyaL (SSP411 family)
LSTVYFESYDTRYAGWGSEQKFIDADSLEYALAHAKRRRGRRRWRALRLAPHRRSSIRCGAASSNTPTRAIGSHRTSRKSCRSRRSTFASTHKATACSADAAFLKAAQNIDRYVQNFLTSADGVVYVSQDADVDAQLTGHKFYAMSDAERRRHPNPHIDTHVYARENGWEITALAALYDATGDERYLARARRAAAWMTSHRATGAGGFSHDGDAAAPAALGDTLAMGQGNLALYVATGERAYLNAGAPGARLH